MNKFIVWSIYLARNYFHVVKIVPTTQDIKINPESMDLKPIVLAALTAVEEEEVIGKVQVVGVVALASIRKYHRCIII